MFEKSIVRKNKFEVGIDLELSKFELSNFKISYSKSKRLDQGDLSPASCIFLMGAYALTKISLQYIADYVPIENTLV